MSTTLDTQRVNGPAAAAARAPSQLSDEELFLGYRASGQRDLFTELVHRYERELYSYLRRHLNDVQLAEDAFQNTWLQVHLKRESFDAGRLFRPWLYTVAVNQAIDLQRRNRKHRIASLDREHGDESPGKLANLLVSAEPAPTDQVSDGEAKVWVQQAVQELPEHLRVVLHLLFHQRMKYREAAEVLQLPVGTVKSRMHAGIAKLSERWRADQK